jgi:hypothetical protein
MPLTIPNEEKIELPTGSANGVIAFAKPAADKVPAEQGNWFHLKYVELGIPTPSLDDIRKQPLIDLNQDNATEYIANTISKIIMNKRNSSSYPTPYDTNEPFVGGKKHRSKTASKRKNGKSKKYRK